MSVTTLHYLSNCLERHTFSHITGQRLFGAAKDISLHCIKTSLLLHKYKYLPALVTIYLWHIDFFSVCSVARSTCVVAVLPLLSFIGTTQ